MIKDLSEEEFQQIRQYKSIANRGRLVSAKAVTDLFNKVFNASAKPVSCATCIRNRIFKMYKELEKYEREQEELKKQEALEALETHVPDVQADEVVEDKVEEVKAPTKRKYVRKKKEVE